MSRPLPRLSRLIAHQRWTVGQRKRLFARAAAGSRAREVAALKLELDLAILARLQALEPGEAPTPSTEARP